MVAQRKRGRPDTVRLEDFLSLEDAHPYGCLPGGNQFFGDESAAATKTQQPELLTDDAWQSVLSFCDAKTLANVVQTSRYFYVAGHQPELWRDLVLRRCDAESRVIDYAKHSWRDTYIGLFVDRSIPLHVPMAIPGIYSDEFYRTHRCRSFAIPEEWKLEQPRDDPNNVAVVNWDEIAPSEFIERYEEKNWPVIIKNAGRNDAFDKWKDASYFQEHNAPNKTFRTTSGGAPLSVNFTLEAYYGYSQFMYLEESPLYLFDRTAFDDNDQWKQDFFPSFYQKCPWWDPSAGHGHDLLQHLGEGRRPDHTWLIMGPYRSGSVFHIDPNATHAWNVCVQGRKRWIFYPPGVSPPGVFPSNDGDSVALPLSVGEWIQQFWPEHLLRLRTAPLAERPLDFTVHPGDILFVPHGWWHMVVNLDDVNMAITHNYVSPSNLGNVLKFFVQKEDQISGCRDREESVKPDRLYSEFVHALEEKDKKALLRAQNQKAWTCHAWKDEDPAEQTVTLPIMQKKRKRPDHHSDDDDEATKSTSVMAKTEKVSDFSFSFF
eukprot:Nitzschia sp. Nitz4//scaffold185_size43419//10018//11649//NITZ4_007296-RA/size43419-processed-gene-0.70-mRNA-1//1//CDS//3329539694//5178//frame0